VGGGGRGERGRGDLEEKECANGRGN